MFQVLLEKALLTKSVLFTGYGFHEDGLKVYIQLSIFLVVHSLMKDNDGVEALQPKESSLQLKK